MNKYAHLAPKRREEKLPAKSWSRCLGKRRYDSLEAALSRARSDGERYGTSLEPYRCPHCLLFHLRSKRARGEPPYEDAC